MELATKHSSHQLANIIKLAARATSWPETPHHLASNIPSWQGESLAGQKRSQVAVCRREEKLHRRGLRVDANFFLGGRTGLREGQILDTEGGVRGILRGCGFGFPQGRPQGCPVGIKGHLHAVVARQVAVGAVGGDHVGLAAEVRHGHPVGVAMHPT